LHDRWPAAHDTRLSAQAAVRQLLGYHARTRMTLQDLAGQTAPVDGRRQHANQGTRHQCLFWSAMNHERAPMLSSKVLTFFILMMGPNEASHVTPELTQL